MSINVWKNLSLDDLKKHLKELKGQLFVMEFQVASGKFNKYADIKKWKIKIAQVLTLIQAKKQKKEKK